MEKHTCKLCHRRFPSGHALGGHMRSHVTPPPSSSTSSHEEDDQTLKPSPLTYLLRQNPRKSIRLVDPQFSPLASSLIVQDLESDTDSPPIQPRHRRRSKRPRPSQPEPDPVSSVYYTTPEEDVAISLIMLSCDAWPCSDHEDEQILEHHQFQCETCKKVFGSYQALGGHRSSHKKVKQIGDGQIRDAASNADRHSKVHQCPICFRVFGSGQALGGHKRSHLTSSPLSISPAKTGEKLKIGECLIDLNLPAPMDDDGVEVSAVSDAEFVVRSVGVEDEEAQDSR